jgi:hypothetical protein
LSPHSEEEHDAMPDTFSYDAWDRLLAAVVSPNGRIDYELLLEERATLEEMIGDFAATSPESHPELFPDTEHALAYWINAYNAFTLDAIVDEYPITSVWKTREGQFFQRRRHLAGGKSVSLDDIEHTILRGDFGEPRIHFAINCGSNGCPAFRSSAYRGEGLQDTLRRATETFLASEWNCRVDDDERKIYISRIFKMYAEDFAGRQGGREEYRRGVLHFVAEHTGLALEQILDYEIVYNLYDWGLNDTHREPSIGPIVFHEPVEHFSQADPELRELHLYEGNFCNRDCSWCTIDGSPDGWYRPYTHAILDQALATLADDGNLKFYGGEPTLHTAGILEAIQYCREKGFAGLVTVFSNGIQADKLIEILESDGRCEAVLNYSIYHGRNAEPLPEPAREKLEAWALANPNRLFQGYKVLFHAGSGTDGSFDQDREAEYHGMGGSCVRCFPVLTTKGRFHACPFAAEVDAPHFDLGRVGSDPDDVLADYRSFLHWVDEVLDPAAVEKGVSSCEMCHRHLEELDPPALSTAERRALPVLQAN